MNLDDVVAQLLAGSLNEFTNRRNAKAKELKAAGERELAAEVAVLKKPPVAVWAVNQLARRNKPVLEGLRRAGEGVVQAQSGAVSGRKNAAAELRSASDAHRGARSRGDGEADRDGTRAAHRQGRPRGGATGRPIRTPAAGRSRPDRGRCKARWRKGATGRERTRARQCQGEGVARSGA